VTLDVFPSWAATTLTGTRAEIAAVANERGNP
jgi:hypothetical protein